MLPGLTFAQSTSVESYKLRCLDSAVTIKLEIVLLKCAFSFPEYKNLKFVESNALSSSTNAVQNEERWLITVRQWIQLLHSGMFSTCFSQCLDQDLISLWEQVGTKAALN